MTENKESEFFIITMSLVITIAISFYLMSNIFLPPIKTGDTNINISIEEKNSGVVKITFKDNYQNGHIDISIHRKNNERLFGRQEIAEKEFSKVEKGDSVKLNIRNGRYVTIYAFDKNKIIGEEIYTFYYDTRKTDKIGRITKEK